MFTILFEKKLLLGKTSIRRGKITVWSEGNYMELTHRYLNVGIVLLFCKYSELFKV